MCIAIYSLKGTDVPSEDILRTCFRNNPDGAGFAFNMDGKVQIVKGFMNFDNFIHHISSKTIIIKAIHHSIQPLPF